MSVKKGSKVAQLAQALGRPPAQAKEFGDEVNSLLARRGHRSVSYAEMCEALQPLAPRQRLPQHVAEAILQREQPREKAGSAASPPSADSVAEPKQARGGTPPPSPTVRAEQPHTAAPSASRPPTVQDPRSTTSPQPPAVTRTCTGSGAVSYVAVHYVTVDVEAGTQCNCLLARWPTGAPPPRPGMRLECRYIPERAEVVEVLKVETEPETPPSSKKPAAPSTGGFDQAYFEERRREGHRHEIMEFLHREREHIEWYRMQPAQDPRFGQPRTALRREVDHAIRRSEPAFRDFYAHQALALDAIRDGRNVLLVTQTASGKTWCYNPAIFEALCTYGANSHALYVFPLNALMMDQKDKVDDLRRHLDLSGHRLDADVLVGGIGSARHQIASRNPHIVCTNPEMLGMMLQEAQTHWRSFFAGLRYVVIDEVHFYRGLLGVHAAGLVRRLLLTARRNGSEPRFVLSSATIANPLDLATRLTSLPASSFVLLDGSSDGSGQQIKHWAVYSPDTGSDRDDYDGYLSAAASAMVALLCSKDARGRLSPLHTVLFAKSMRDVDKVHQMVVDSLKKREPALSGKVRKFISARLEPDDKRDIYEGLKDGRYVGVVSTNALEAGIDIGRLDVCILAGFPFTVMRMRQMAGRVGRRDEGLVLYVPHPVGAVDEYYRHNPRLLLEQSPEVFVVDAENPYIIRKHLNAVAADLKGITPEESRIFGPRVAEMVREAASSGVMQDLGGRFLGTRRDFRDMDDVYAIHNIRARVQRPYAICPDDGIPCEVSSSCLDSSASGDNRCRRRIGVIDRQYVYRDCHPGAVYEDADRGALYRIVSISDEDHLVRARVLPEGTLERTFVDESTSVEMLDAPAGAKELLGDVRMAWGKVLVRRSFDGYYTQTLSPARRCRRCRKEFDDTTSTCPDCGRPTVTFFRRSKPDYREFPPPYNQRGFTLSMRTTAAWLTISPQLEARLADASPCKLPGDRNAVQGFLRTTIDLKSLKPRLRLNESERQIILSYYQAASSSLRRARPSAREAVLFPGIYGQCLLSALRQALPESRSLEIFQAVTGYPVTTDLRHVCRNCQTSVLLPAMHTLEHTVAMRYPSVALGDQSDLGSFTTLGHAGAGGPAIFWYDNYEGGIGAAEKIFDRIADLLQASYTTIDGCSCTTVEGCPYCTQIASCSSGNDPLSKPAAVLLIHVLLGREASLGFDAFVYRARQKSTFDQDYAEHEHVAEEHGIGPERPQAGARPARDPYNLLRIQRSVHESVLHRAFEVRSVEITGEVPAVSAQELQEAFERVTHDPRPTDWALSTDMESYRVLEVLPSATIRMIGRVYRVIARELHPDVNPQRRQWATRMMQIVNAAYEKVRKDKGSRT